VDRAAVRSIRELPWVVEDDAPHRDEHGLEVHLPFFQLVLGTFTVVPLVVGEAAAGEVAGVLARLWGGDETLVVISSDLSHYLGHGAARRRDAATAAAIEALDGGRLGPQDACGCRAIAGLLAEAARRGLVVRRLDLRNSGDTAGPKDRVFGYGAWMFREGALSEGRRHLG
jgi:AmmeMemoRadiSam system protein B